MEKILLAESERDLSKAIENYLSLFNVNVFVANDGVQILNEFSSNTYDIVIIDDNLSRIDSIDVIKKIRCFNNRVKIILLSSKTMCEEIKGYDEVILSPFTPFELRESLCKVGGAL